MKNMKMKIMKSKIMKMKFKKYDSKNYDNEIDKTELIDDINNNKYNSFIEYITPTKCKHFYHKSCVDKEKFFNCYFCKFFITIENMKKFGCFFSKEDFNRILVGRYDNNLLEFFTKLMFISKIEKIFYPQIENSYFLNQRKKEKLLKLKNINKKFIDNLNVLYRYHNNKVDDLKYYKLSINSDMDKVEEDLNYEIKCSEEFYESIKREREREREEEERREREEEERRERERERYEEERERQREIKKNNKTIDLRICKNCYEFCVLCKRRIPSGMARTTIFYKCHSGCYRDDLCLICGKKRGARTVCQICAYCVTKSHRFECYYCRKKFLN